MSPGLSLPGVLLTFREREKHREAAGAVVGHRINGHTILVDIEDCVTCFVYAQKSPAYVQG